MIDSSESQHEGGLYCEITVSLSPDGDDWIFSF